MSDTPTQPLPRRRPLVGAQIRRRRLERGLTLAGVAALTGLNVGYLSQLENDKASPSLETLAAPAQPRSQWTLAFASPTAIRWGEADNRTRRVELFPQPRPAIAGLRTRWDHWTGEAWGRDFEEWVERNVVVSRIDRWQTQPITFQNQRYSGGLGQLAYRLLDPSELARAAHLDRLWRLAFYTGIGYKTTHGLGQVRLLDAATPGEA